MPGASLVRASALAALGTLLLTCIASSDGMAPASPFPPGLPFDPLHTSRLIAPSILRTPGGAAPLSSDHPSHPYAFTDLGTLGG
jgi:hypothetical protein